MKNNLESPDTVVRHPNAFLEYLKPLESILSRFYFYFHRTKLKNTTNAEGGTSTGGSSFIYRTPVKHFKCFARPAPGSCKTLLSTFNALFVFFAFKKRSQKQCIVCSVLRSFLLANSHIKFDEPNRNDDFLIVKQNVKVWNSSISPQVSK